MMEPTHAYVPAQTDRLFWCNRHGRRATHIGSQGPCCDPSLGGILLPCMVVDLTDEAEVEDDK